MLGLLLSILLSAVANPSDVQPYDIENAVRMEKEGNDRDAYRVYSYLLNDSTENDFFRFYSALGIGRILSRRGEYQGSFDAYEKSIDLARLIGPDFLDGNNARFNLANLYTDFGKYDDALRLLKECRWGKATEGSRKSAALTAVIAARQGDNLHALAVIDSVIPEFIHDATNHAVLLQNRAYILRDLNRLPEAEQDFIKAVSLLPDNSAEHFVALSNLALIQSQLDKPEDALRNINRCVGHLRKHTENGNNAVNDLAITLRKKGEILAMENRLPEARECFREFFTLDRESVLTRLPEMSPSTRLDYWTMEKPSLSKIFLLDNFDPDFLAEVAIFRHMTSMMGMNDTDRLAEKLSFDLKSLRKALPAHSVMVQLVEYESIPDIPSYGAIITPTLGTSTFVPLFSRDFIHDTEQITPLSIYEAVTSENPEAINALYSDPEIATLVWQPILNAIPDNVSDIYFTPEGIFHLWGIENMNYQPLSNLRLHRLSSVAAIADLSSSKKSPDKSLIVGGLDYSDQNPDDTSRYTEDELADHSAFRALAESISLNEGRPIFSYLPATRLEADGIAAIIPVSDKFNRMSERQLKNLISDYSTIHIATHGYCIDSGIADRPHTMADSIAVDISLLYSGLALSGANNGNNLPGDDGILSAREICNLDLKGVDLITLSACQTAKGRITDEGVSGMVRALKMAGAGSIIASLWEVDDNSTRLFMQRFYSNLASGMDKRDAFDNARNYLQNFKINVSRKKFSPKRLAGSKQREYFITEPYSQPFFHSPFILID